ncbi:hypothetical protein CQ018_01915 [Arthrobacter sp. MYb227]|uniref:mycothiol transferase n=1 Tax=Arthrobacter sp. MYb227 TaxID=1848601 RepID=UPI000CFDD958|nr:DUF664 domain-containing protein [Arthrobacter sp. MYb227]PQZ96471.1 hypothetical protein CQ018_01915 [Arthrobacter sp. MYb227]
MKSEDAVLVALLRDGFERVNISVTDLMEQASPQMLRYRPEANANHIAWLIWHLSRIQDDHFVHLARALWPTQSFEECWISGGWSGKFKLPYAERETGYGQTSEQVQAFGMYDAALLAAYHSAVHQGSNAILGKLQVRNLQTIIDHRWNPPVSTAVRLVSVLEDTTKHIGQAEYISGLFSAAPHS